MADAVLVFDVRSLCSLSCTPVSAKPAASNRTERIPSGKLTGTRRTYQDHPYALRDARFAALPMTQLALELRDARFETVDGVLQVIDDLVR